MEKELPVVMIEDNFGAQYHNYFLSIVLTNPKNRFFIYENYIELSIKHQYDSHIDYAYDGIYACNHNIMNKFIIRGPAEDLHSVIQKSIDSSYYVVLNINEQFLPDRQAYANYYFRHDLLVIGYNDETKQYITIGFDADMHYTKTKFNFHDVEEAYYRMQNEWDFEIFIFDFNRAYDAELDVGKIKLHIENYCAGKNPNRFYFEEYIKEPDKSIGFVNNSYVGSYYGINVYDYLIDRIKKQYKIFGTVEEDEKLGVLDLRSLNVLKTHQMIIRHILENIDGNIPSKIIERSERIEKTVIGVKVLLLKFFSTGEKKNCKKAVEMLKKVKAEELDICHQILCLL